MVASGESPTGRRRTVADATVTVEAPGIEPVPLGRDEVMGCDQPVVAGAVSREVARDSTVLRLDG